MKIEDVAKICHEANRALCQATGDNSQVPWEEASMWQKEAALDGVRFVLDNPEAGADAQHNKWAEHKLNDGWRYGEVKDPEKKEHPCLVPFDALPANQQAKDYLIRGVVLALRGFIQ